MTLPARLLTWLLLLASLAACGRPNPAAAPAEPPVSPAVAAALSGASGAGSPAWAGGPVLVRPEGSRGPLVVYEQSDGQERFRLPAGLLTADGQRFFAAEVREATTGLRTFDPATGRLTHSAVLDGQWALSAASPTGLWAAFTRLPDAAEKREREARLRWTTEVLVVDAGTGLPAHVLSLEGNFEVETLSADGKSLFLIEHRPAYQPDHYVIRLYDLSNQSLIADPLRSKGNDDVMAGLAWEGVGTPDGRWLLTLYLSTRRSVAFIHTLNLKDKFPVCIDLPSDQGDPEKLRRYTLALAPDGETVYATNPALGVVAEVSLTELRVTRVVRFEPDASVADAAYTALGRSVLSPDGETLYFTSAASVWTYSTRTGQLGGPYRVDSPPLGLGLSADGERLYVARADQPLLVLEAATGQMLSFPAASQSGLDPAPLAPTAECRVTWPDPPLVPPSGLEGASPSSQWFGNDSLWTLLPPNGDLLARLEANGALGLKFPWWRVAAGPLTVRGQRLDAAAPPLQAVIPDGYGDSGFQASGLIFPTEGCWEIVGEVGGQSLRFVVHVQASDSLAASR